MVKLGEGGVSANEKATPEEGTDAAQSHLELVNTSVWWVEHERSLSDFLSLHFPRFFSDSHAAPEVGQTYNRVLELCGQAGETASLFPALFGLWRFNYLRPDLPKARELAEQMLRLAQSSHDPGLLLPAHQAVGASLFWLGELRQGQRYLEQGIALYDIHKHRSHAFHYGIDPGVYCLCSAGWNLWCLGYPDQALKKAQDAVHLARELAHPVTLALAFNITSYFYQFRHDAAAVRAQAEAQLTLSTEHGFAFRAAVAAIMRGWALAAAGQAEEGVVQMQEGLAAQRATGSEAVQPYFLALLAETYGQMGRPQDGLTTLAVALAAVEKTGEQWYKAELWRLKGQLMLQQVQVSGSTLQGPGSQHLTPGSLVEAEAEACFHKAIEIARHQQAKSLELRAAMSLSRLWQHQGRQAAARQMLAEVYGWFTEGFDTKDLQEAKALLEELH
jgi:predicted ATPase